TCSQHDTPASRRIWRFSSDGWPQCHETMGTPSSAHTFTWASLSKQVMKLTLNGDGVAAFTVRTYSRRSSGGVKPTPMAPMPPALLTAMARSGVMPAKAKPAQAKGWRTPKRCVKRVAIDGMIDMVVSLEPGSVGVLRVAGPNDQRESRPSRTDLR